MSRPFSQACENNKQFILDRLQHLLSNDELVLEIGTGTAQHVRYFAQNMANIHWQPSDIPENLPTVMAGLADNTLENISAPLALDVTQQPWPVGLVDMVFTANTLHIMGWAAVEEFFSGLEPVLKIGGLLCIYGPFKYQGEFTSQSNGHFDSWLKDRNPLSGVRDFERIAELAEAQDLVLLDDFAMPANNQMLIWKKVGTSAIN